MATASKRLTRKQIRQPDWLHVTAEKAIEFYERNQLKVLIAAAAVVVLLIAIWAWQVFKDRQNIEAAQQFTRAISLYQSEKYRDAIPAFQKVEGYRWSTYSLLAQLYAANSYLAVDDLDKSIAAAQRFIAGTRSNSLFRQMGLLALGAAKEKKQDCKQAVEHYSQAARINAALRDQATMARGRCSEKIGDIKGAVAAYQEYLKNNPDPPFAVHVTELEAKVRGQATSK
jgi:hypothetical protein